MSASQNTAEIQVVVDASGVEAGLRQATGAAERAERQITAGANNSARSQGNLIAAIQRTTAQMESGGRAGSRYFEILAQQRGVNPAALEPYLRQLRAVEQAQQRAGQSAAQTSNAMRQLPAQMTDVLVSLQGGQSPLTVLLQQGGQVTDSFGGVGNAIRNVGSHILGLLNPVTLATAAVAGLTYAYYAGSQEARAYNLAIATTGNAAGTSAALMAEAAAQTAEFVGSQSNAAKVLASMVATGQISGAVMIDLSVAAIKAQRDLGREVSTTVEEFASLGKDPVKALADLIGKYHHLSGATYAQVKALQDEGRTVEAVTLAQKAHADGINSQSARVVENLGYIESAWKGIKNGVLEAAGATKDWFLSMGRDDTLADLTASAAKIQKNIDDANARNDTWGARKQQALLDVVNAQIAAMQKKLGLSKQEAEEEARRSKADQMRIEIANGLDALLSREQLRERELAATRRKAAENRLTEAETEQALAIVRHKYKDVDEAAQKKREAAAKAAAEALKKEAGLLAELAGLTPGFAEDWDRLSKAYAKGALSLDQLTKAQADLLAKQPGIKKANDEQIKAQAESDKLYEQGIKTAEQYRDSLLEQLGAQRLSNEVIGLSAEAAADLQVRRLEDAAALKEQTAAALDAVEPGSRVAELYRAQAAALRDLASAKSEGARKQVAADSAKQAADDWRRAAEDINRSLTDALLRGFESGKSFGRNLVDTLKNMFQTLVLRPIIQPMMAPISGSLAGMMPGSAQASTGAGGYASALQNIWGMANGSAISYGATKGVTSAANWMMDSSNPMMQKMGASLGNNAGMLSSGLGMLGNGLAGYGISKGLSGGYSAGNWVNIAAGIASAIPGIGPIAGVVGALVNRAFGMKAKEYGDAVLNGSFDSAGFSGSTDTAWTQKGGWFRSDKNGVDRNAVGAEMSAGLTSAYDAIKSSSAEFARVLGINADSIASRSQAISIAMGKDEAANQKAIADFFVGVGNTIAGELLPEIGKFQAQGEAASATLQRLATGYSTIEQALWSIGMSFGAVGTASLEARERLLAAAGGIEAFAANTAGFQQNFLSEAERNAPVLKMVTEQMAALGLASVDTRDEFKQVVLGLDLTTEAGAKQYGALMNLQAAFAQVYPATEAATKALQERASLQEELDQLTMTSVQLQAKQRDALDESNRPLFDQIQALKESRAALEAQAEAQRNATQAIKEQATSLLSGVDGAFGVLQRVVARDKQLLQERITTEQAIVAKHQALSSALRSTLDGMSVPGQELFGRQSAQAQIQAALAMAKASGSLPDADGLKRALSVVGQDASALYATQQDYLRDFYTTQNDIAALADITDSTLSIEEKSLKLLEEEGKRLDSILTSAQQQIDVLKGIDTSVLSVADAVAALGLSIASAKGNAVVASAGAVNAQYQSVLGRAPDAAGMQFWQDQAAKGVSQTDILNAIANSAEANIKSMYQATLGRAADAGGLQFWVDQVNKGTSYADIQRALEQSGEKLRGFAVGTNYVPTNMPAMIHEGERIIPAADNRELMRRLSNPEQSNAVLAAAVERLTREVEGLRAEARATATHTEKTARLFDRVIEGNEIKVKAEA
ncbi:phage tail length tape measure family protein [Massilia sp. UBA6681]|uniref:phage tail length tape measure family protein n=1 Tax=Massilia sp. UBA6681 TaxID=1946839 RepID=UPI0025C396C0|nr:phage tail length tape measure family protein [Massilia sp. UBA6681]